MLEAELAGEEDPLATLGQLGPRLLSLLSGDRAVALNRAAAAGSSGELGAAISIAVRESVLPLIVRALERARRSGQLNLDQPAEAASLYMNLLVGDLQFRRGMSRVPAPTAEVCDERARLAVERLSIVLDPGTRRRTVAAD